MLTGNLDSIQLRYEQLEVVGQGGMGQVVRAIDKLNQRDVAIKTLRPDHAQERSYFNYAFFQEVRAMASLEHKNLINVYDFGLYHDDRMYMVMEWIEGCTLEACYKLPTALPWPVLGYIITEVLEGLLHAHARGIIHRDLKPTNIMLQLHGPSKLPDVKIIDFGIALLGEERYRNLEATLGSNVLANLPLDPPQEQRLLLTPPYGAPEQLRDPYYYKGPATDFYALGVILYQFCYHHLPFLNNAQHYSDVLQKMLDSSPPRNLPLVNQAPQDVVHLILNDLMKKEPWYRTSHARTLLTRLHQSFDKPTALALWPSVFASLRNSNISSPQSIEIPATLPLPPDFLPRESRDLPSGQPLPNTEAVVAERRTSAISTAMRVALHYPSLVGRTELREQLGNHMHSHWTQSQRFIGGETNQPAKAFVLLTGDAGIGKSHLAQWACELCYEKYWMLDLHTDFQLNSASPQGIERAIENHFGWHGASHKRIEGNLRERWGNATSELRQTIAGIADLLRPASIPKNNAENSTTERVLLDRPETRHAVRLQALQLIANPPRKQKRPSRPLLLWFDNIEFANQEDLDFLALLEKHPHLSVMVLGTARTSRLHDKPVVQKGLQHIQESWPYTEHRLEPLHNENVRELLHQWLPLSLETQEKACQRSQGNPLFALQHIYAWAQSGVLSWNSSSKEYTLAPHALATIPEASQSHWAQRIEGLSKAAQFAALCLTSLGSELLPSVIDQLFLELRNTDTPLAQVNPDEIISELLQSQLLLSEYRRLVWYHGMLEEYLVLQLQQHSQATDVYDAAYEALGHHPQHQERGVVRLRTRAALSAKKHELAFTTMMSFVEAEWRQHRDGRAILQDLDLLQDKLPQGQHAYYWRWRTEVLVAQTEMTQAGAACETLLTHAGEENNPLERAHGLRLQAALYDTLGATEQGRDGVREKALALAQQALDIFHQLDNLPHQAELVGQAECRLLLSNIQYNLSHYNASTSWAHSALIAFEQCNLPRGASQSSLYLGFSLADQGRYQEAQTWLTQLQERYTQQGDTMGIAQCQFCMGWLALYRGNLERGRQLATQAQHSFDQQNQHWWHGVACILLGWLYGAANDYDVAQQYIGTATHIFESMGGMPHEQGHALLLKTNLALRQNQPVQAEKYLMLVAGSQRPEPQLQQALAMTQAWYLQTQGKHTEAWTALQEGIHLWRTLSLTAFGVPCILRQLLESPHWPRSVRLDLEAWQHSLQLS